MKKKRRIIIAVFLVLLIGVAALVYFGQWRSKSGELYYSGTIETTQANLAFQVSGRVLSIPVKEGQPVNKGQLIAELDTAELQSRCDQARANLDRTLKTQKQAETAWEIYKSALPADVAKAEAGIAAAKAQLAELKAGTRAQDIERAHQTYLAAKAVMDDAKKNLDRYTNLYQKDIISEREFEAVRLRYETSLRDYKRTEETYDLAKEGVRKETIEAAQAKLSEGEALLKQAKSNLKKIDMAKQDTEAARAQVKAAEAALRQAEIYLNYAKLTAPFPGIVTSRNVEVGEIVSAGREVMTVSDLSQVDLKIFVDEMEIGKVKPGQEVDVKVDTFPDKTYKGKVSFISPEGEFTPKIIQTRKERVKLVYLVKVTLPNPHHELKSGMPADAWLR
ncbi:MAG: efflux RND transporter periplasmic adaptor subunit [Deltaproteobacteria bacterium]|nr:efflux RND transporter periplasmic adaptor subunit [Deltaproteobacteria bacterium]